MGATNESELTAMKNQTTVERKSEREFIVTRTFSGPARLVWTNAEGGEDGAVTTVTFEEHGDDTLVVVHDLYPSKEALDRAIASGSTGGFGEAFEQLDELLAALGTSVRQS